MFWLLPFSIAAMASPCGGAKVSASRAKWVHSGSKPDSTKDPLCIGSVACHVIRRGPLSLRLLRCGRSEGKMKHQISDHNDEVRSERALLLLQTGR
ncbi:hypothetical protein AVEN_239361-1 [Araneus ventricosus]|uniref:Secreted protein n=1 Tax=Araneus ventricosus TaxID=182803 RepID=A0A4Y2EBA3_ARAVE|nr:hypothetical protein AVEN_239361-1 [Araneus ventricosus]